MTAPPACDLCHAEGAKVMARKYDLDYLRCGDCGFVFADTRTFDFAAYNDQNIGAMRDTHIAKLDSARYRRAYAALLKQFEPYRQTGRFLEVGCATGSFLKQVQRAGWQGQGVEPVAASARHAIDELGLRVHVGTLATAGIEPGSVDVVYSNAVIEHVSSPSEVLMQAYDALRPGGLLYADTVNLDSYTWRFLGERWRLFDPRMHLSLFTPGTLAAVCAQVGFKVVNMRTHGVRFHATRADRPRGIARLFDELRKAPYSMVARSNLKGDNVAVYAEKPQ